MLQRSNRARRIVHRQLPRLSGGSALANKLNVDESEVRRILNPTHRTKRHRLEQAAKALGGRLEITFVPIP